MGFYFALMTISSDYLSHEFIRNENLSGGLYGVSNVILFSMTEISRVSVLVHAI